ncbi:IS66 family insertion sequence element accessory protein TnpB [Roseateles sp.]|uniref:IS66 family insertion sequence element accessory protein TnpB n=1 Tax=Roseateles sp. TaxID=1971397 RepID=UPI00359FCEFB
MWLAVQPLDMRLGTEAALARVVGIFGAAHPHHAYLFTNRRANRLKCLVHDGIGVWPLEGASKQSLTRVQLDALVLGLPWQRLGDAGIIRTI